MNLQSSAVARSPASHTASPTHVLAVDDDPDMRALFSNYLGENNFRVTAVADGHAMRTVLAEQIVDLLLLDLKLPAEDGMAIAQRLREESAIPIIIVSGCRDEADRVMSLELGADDYVTKPFSPRELLARIRTVLRRRRAEVKPGRPEGVRAYRFDGWELNLDTRRLLTRDARQVRLSNGEFNLLVVLLASPQRILSRDQLIDLSRLHNDDVFNRAIDMQIMRLRRKLEVDAAHPRYIKTERGAGYVFGVPVETVY